VGGRGVSRITLLCAKIPVVALSPILGMSFLSAFSKQAPVFLVCLRLFLGKSEKKILAFPSRVSRAKQIDRRRRRSWQFCEQMCQVASTGVPIAFVITRALYALLDINIVCKLMFPGLKNSRWEVHLGWWRCMLNNDAVQMPGLPDIPNFGCQSHFWSNTVPHWVDGGS
jgi:hypothetical protein